MNSKSCFYCAVLFRRHSEIYEEEPGWGFYLVNYESDIDEYDDTFIVEPRHLRYFHLECLEFEEEVVIA